jgi:UDP-galactopyranose mutase
MLGNDGMKPFLIVGAGFSGAVLARELVNHTDRSVVIIDQRSHIAGNCHTSRDSTTGIMVHQYGPHIFNTNSELVWQYINHYGEFRAYTNRVKAKTQHGIFSLPINLHTINQYFKQAFTPIEAQEFIRTLGDQRIHEPQNFEEQALKFVGRELYETFFYGYTKKQWGCEPKELPASILKRLPIRFNYNDAYYNAKYQGIPVQGYTAIVEAILQHERITVCLNSEFSQAMRSEFEHVFYTGCLDAFFNFKLGHLGYRTVFWKRSETKGDFQGNAVINYTELEVPYTRVHEHKHFTPWEEHPLTLYFTEFSKETELGDIPYYPKRLVHDKELFASYCQLAEQERQVSFLGRLGTYRYMNIDEVISEALQFSHHFLQAYFQERLRPIFPESGSNSLQNSITGLSLSKVI